MVNSERERQLFSSETEGEIANTKGNPGISKEGKREREKKQNPSRRNSTRKERESYIKKQRNPERATNHMISSPLMGDFMKVFFLFFLFSLYFLIINNRDIHSCFNRPFLDLEVTIVDREESIEPTSEY